MHGAIDWHGTCVGHSESDGLVQVMDIMKVIGMVQAAMSMTHAMA